jgi:hypothetical protein
MALGLLYIRVLFLKDLQLLDSTRKEKVLFLNIVMSSEREESVLKCLVDVDVKTHPNLTV